MRTRSLERGRQTFLRSPLKNMVASTGMLLALDGFCLERPAFPRALQHCRRAGSRLDILLLNPPKPATLMLGRFLQTLEEERIDYRLSTGEGDLADELPHYLHRFKDISIILLGCDDRERKRLHPTLDVLRLEGYKVMALRDCEHGLPGNNTEQRVVL